MKTLLFWILFLKRTENILYLEFHFKFNFKGKDMGTSYRITIFLGIQIFSEL